MNEYVLVGMIAVAGVCLRSVVRDVSKIIIVRMVLQATKSRHQPETLTAALGRAADPTGLANRVGRRGLPPPQSTVTPELHVVEAPKDRDSA